MKILILKPSSLGDVIQALPVLRLLKRHLPASEIFWWIDTNLAPLFEGDPDLTGIVRFERHRWAAPQNWPEMFRSIQWMRAQEFDLVIDLQSLVRSGAFAWLANGKFLIGLDDFREGARGFYDLAVRRASFHTHAVDWYLAVLPHLGVPVDNHFQWLPERPKVAAEIKRKWQVGMERRPPARHEEDGNNPRAGSETGAPNWIALQPGARWPNKRWPVEFFAELVRLMAQKFPDARFAILGGEEDKPLAGIISRIEPERCFNLCGQASLPEMIEWIRLSELMITNDTGPMHVAAALNKPLIALFGPTEPRRTGPYHQLDSVLQIELPCSPCLKSRCRYVKPNECLNAIPPAMVFEQAQRKLQQAGRCS